MGPNGGKYTRDLIIYKGKPFHLRHNQVLGNKLNILRFAMPFDLRKWWSLDQRGLYRSKNIRPCQRKRNIAWDFYVFRWWKWELRSLPSCNSAAYSRLSLSCYFAVSWRQVRKTKLSLAGSFYACSSSSWQVANGFLNYPSLQYGEFIVAAKANIKFDSLFMECKMNYMLVGLSHKLFSYLR